MAQPGEVGMSEGGCVFQVICMRAWSICTGEHTIQTKCQSRLVNGPLMRDTERGVQGLGALKVQRERDRKEDVSGSSV